MDYLDEIQERHKELYEKIYNSHEKVKDTRHRFRLEGDSSIQLYVVYDVEDEIFVVTNDEFDSLLFFTSINQYKALLKLLKFQAMS